MISRYAKFETAFVSDSSPKEAVLSRGRVSMLLDRVLCAGLLAMIMLAVVAHGAVEPWSVALFELMAIQLLVVWNIKAALDRTWQITFPLASAPLTVFLILGFMQ